MSHYNKNEAPVHPEDTNSNPKKLEIPRLDNMEKEGLNDAFLDKCGCDHNDGKVIDSRNSGYLNSPEITCSPSPCIFDDCIRKVNMEDRLSPSRSSIGNRSPSPCSRSPSPNPRSSPHHRRRSHSPFRRSASPGSRRGSSATPTGYEMYQKSLLEVPVILDYGDASSDDLSSEWDSDAPEAPPQQKVRSALVFMLMARLLI